MKIDVQLMSPAPPSMPLRFTVPARSCAALKLTVAGMLTVPVLSSCPSKVCVPPVKFTVPAPVTDAPRAIV